MRKKKTSKRKSKRQTKKICNRCGGENPVNANKCTGCGSKRFAPKWVLARREVNRQVGVEITTSNPDYGKVHKRITLSKWWPGGSTSFHIPNASQWERIESIINKDLGRHIGWKTKKEIISKIQEKKRDKDNRNSQDYPFWFCAAIGTLPAIQTHRCIMRNRFMTVWTVFCAAKV